MDRITTLVKIRINEKRKEYDWLQYRGRFASVLFPGFPTLDQMTKTRLQKVGGQSHTQIKQTKRNREEISIEFRLHPILSIMATKDPRRYEIVCVTMLMIREDLIQPYVRAHPDREVAERMSYSLSLANSDSIRCFCSPDDVNGCHGNAFKGRFPLLYVN